MIRSDADVPYINEVTAHRATNIVYRTGPARKVQLVVPSARHPSPQSAVIRNLRRTRPCSNAHSNLRAAYGRVESLDTETGSKDAETGRVGNHTSNHVEHGEEWYLQSQVRVSHDEDCPRDSGLRAADFDNRNSENTLCDNEEGKDMASTVLRIHGGLCAADFEDSEDEDSLCDDADIRGLDLEANIRWPNCKHESRIPQEHRLTTMQLRIQEDVLRDIVQQALRARVDGRVNSTIFSTEAPEEEDWEIEMILEVMKLGQSMIDAGALQGEEGHDIQMMMQDFFHNLMRKATRPFRPSGIRVLKVELTQCLDAFRQMRLRLLREKADMSMSEILRERSLALTPR